MNPGNLPVRATPDREYLGAIVDLLVEQNRLVAELLDRIPPATTFVVGTLEQAEQPVVISEPVATAPPRSGIGSGRAAWAAYATAAGVQVADDLTRDQIITACQQAGIPT